jgi:hypothetical protein
VTRSKTIMALSAVAGGIAVIAFVVGWSDSRSHGEGNSGMAFLLPIYASLIPIYVAAARRRKGCKKNG